MAQPAIAATSTTAAPANPPDQPHAAAAVATGMKGEERRGGKVEGNGV